MTSSPAAWAAALSGTIFAERDHTESRRQLTEPVLEGLIKSKLCRMALPENLDGLECDPVTVGEVLHELGRAEASVAWIVWNNVLPCFFGRFLSEPARQEIFGNPTSLFASSTRPTGRAVVADGVIRVSGRWSLVSGCIHADWIALMCLVEKDGELQMIAPGAPQMSLAYIPKASLEIVDTWHVGGLRGTGSHDVVVEDLNVPVHRVVSPITDQSTIDSPLGRIPIVCSMASGHAAMCLGIAQGALHSLLELADTKVSTDPGPGLRDRPASQYAVAVTAARLTAARANLRRAAGQLWEKVLSGGSSIQHLADVWSASYTATTEAKSAVDAMYELAGSTALYTDCWIERAHRDIHAAAQHVIAQPFWIEQAGRVRFGLEPTHPLFAL